MATTRLATFTPNDVTIVITQQSTGISHIVSGFSEDSIVNVERNADTFMLYTGADDTNTRIYNANTASTVTLSLQQTSASNDILTALYENDRQTRNGLFSITIRDNSGRSEFFSEEAYIGIVPSSAYSNQMNTREWVIHAPKLDTLIGGNAILSPEDKDVLDKLGVTLAPRWV